MSVADKIEILNSKIPQVYEKGKKDEYDKFWDNFQDYGNRTKYSYAFTGYGWNTYNFYPKYDIKPEDGTHIFRAWEHSSSAYKLSLKQRLEECGVKLDTSKVKAFDETFSYNTEFTEIPTIDLTSATSISNLFTHNYGTLKTIEKIIVNENTPMGNWFGTNSTGVVNLTIDGTIGKNGFNVKDCKKLSTASILSILTALSKDSTIASGKSITFATSHQSVIETDAQCLEQYNLAINAGWTIAYV